MVMGTSRSVGIPTKWSFDAVGRTWKSKRGSPANAGLEKLKMSVSALAVVAMQAKTESAAALRTARLVQQPLSRELAGRAIPATQKAHVACDDEIVHSLSLRMMGEATPSHTYANGS